MADKHAYGSSRAGNIFGELVLIAIILYFAWRAGDMVNYSQRLVPVMLADDKETLAHVLGYIMKFGGNSLYFLTLALPVAVLLSGSAQQSLTSSIAGRMIVWAALGWWIGRSFKHAYAAKISCQQSSFFGIGCYLDVPFLSYLAFCLIGIVIAVTVGMFLLGTLFGRFGEA